MSGCHASLLCQQRAVLNSRSSQCLLCLVLGRWRCLCCCNGACSQSQAGFRARTGELDGKPAPAPSRWQREEVWGLLLTQPSSMRRGERGGLRENVLKVCTLNPCHW